MPIDSGHAPRSSSPLEVTLLNLSAERCCVLAQYPFAARAGETARLYHGSECIRTEILWVEAELAALAFENRLSEAAFNRLAAVFFCLECISVSNPHASQRELTRVVSLDVKRSHWARWGTNPPRKPLILDLGHDRPGLSGISGHLPGA